MESAPRIDPLNLLAFYCTRHSEKMPSSAFFPFRLLPYSSSYNRESKVDLLHRIG